MMNRNMHGGRLGEHGGETNSDYAETDPSGRYGRYEEILGKGATKTVYKAIDEVFGMEVAWNQIKLKDLFQSEDDLHRLYSEVHLLSTLSHESIIKFYTSWIDVDRRTFNFITEMFTSGNLREYRKKYKLVHICAIKHWARQILAGLAYLHAHDPPVIHRDIKCDNIFVNGHLGQVKIGDLGLAAILRGSSTAHSVIGTPEFMAPELYEENYNELVDVYSFGMCVLEMLTNEYPYSECTNPAQIYKKVTSGKLPRSFYKIQDLEAQHFIGKCVQVASKRLSAKELLLDPFLACDEEELFRLTNVGQLKPFLNDDIRIEELQLAENASRTNMTITGTLNPADDTIFLKVQITDKDETTRNIYFPFDIVSDTPLDVATEMVKELEITYWEPVEIAKMIDDEISALVPDWRKSFPSQSDHFHILNYQDNDHQRFYSSSSSSQMSVSGLMMSSHEPTERTRGYEWLQDDLYDDTSSQSSSHSEKYSNLNYCSGEDFNAAHKSTRFSGEESSSNRQNKVLINSQQPSTSKDSSRRKLTRNNSLVDLRSQLLHRSLVEEVHKRRMFKTVGAVENIGFQTPYEQFPSKVSRGRSSK